MKFDTRKVVRYWVKNAELKWETAKSLKRSRKYADCLFFCHLVLECLLKAHACQHTNRPAPYNHRLDRLAELAGLTLAPEQKALLKEANVFNMKARYDTYQLSFHQKATKQFTEKYFSACAAMRVWLLKGLQKKTP